MWAAIIAAIVSAAAQYYGNEQQARAVNKATNDAMLNQGKYSEKIQEMAAQRAQQYDTDTRKEQQDALTQELTDAYIKQPTSAVDIANSATTTQGDISGDYTKAKEASNQRVKDSIETFGNLLAKVNGAKTLRQQENWANADLANQVGVQQALMRSQNTLDNYKIQQAQNKGSGWNTFGQLAGLAGTALSLGSTAGLLGSTGATTQAATNGALNGLNDFSAKGMGYLFNI